MKRKINRIGMIALATLVFMATFLLNAEKNEEGNWGIASAMASYGSDDGGGEKTFTDCWGSGSSGVSCSNSGAIVYGCQPDPGSYCVGAPR
ncbi:hypothetical protein [Pedobacter hiemivivus]|uniref:Uncharacterized protein n=1 Tax=Pedobacter hiemivivus TaxID=2530454 RepID=A0A4R0N8W7_9SPHI|nr:hypothetical protein [Pedobacter hiemivivus]TCC96560.1 hypothetical protein EZ444_11330 [Pedobacter hiemivivus]